MNTDGSISARPACGNETLVLAGKPIGAGHPALLIAEVGQAHDGSLGTAHAYIDAVAEIGVDAIKFQTHIAKAESSSLDKWRIPFSKQDSSRYAYWQRMEFAFEQWRGLRDHAVSKGLIFLSSPFSVEAVSMLNALDVAAFKVASGEISSHFLVDEMLKTKRPLLISTGMSSWEEIDAAVKKCRASRQPFALFQCTSAYPAGISRVGLNVIGEMKMKYNCAVGLSDHTGNIDVNKAALARGADLLEAHVVFDRRMFGPDSSSSLTIDEFKSLVNFRNTLHELDNHPVDKDAVADELSDMRTLFRRSIFLKTDLQAGTILRAEHLILKKPAVGLPEAQLAQILGKRLKQSLSQDSLLTLGDIE